MKKPNDVPYFTTALKGPLLALEEHFLKRQVMIEAWFRQQWKMTAPLFYGSVDLRNAGFKLAPVDTNLFPAGFNNLNPEFFPLCVQAVQATIAEICPDVTRLLLIPESHTRNIFYLENVACLKTILESAGFEVRIGMANVELTAATKVDLPSGLTVIFEPLIREGERVGVKDFFPCCIILNNDLSTGVPEILQGIEQIVLPTLKLGWSNRLKSKHFDYYAKVSEEFSQHIELDPWLITPYFDHCPEVDFLKKEGQECLINQATKLLSRVRKKYDEYQIKQEPFLVIKADQGTYGMAVMMIKDPQELKNLSHKKRTRMSVTKGGVAVTRVIVQEGIYTFETVGEDQVVAEPVVYLIGRHVVGGFYRVHKNRGPDENLNAPGMDFYSLAFAEPCQISCDKPEEKENRFYAYGVVARLAILAAARELEMIEKEQGV